MDDRQRFYPTQQVRVARGKDYLECQGTVMSVYKNIDNIWVCIIDFKDEERPVTLPEDFLERAI